jgi:hypothetical protein
MKTFRLPKRLAEVLAADADEKNITTTDLLVSILTRYVEFDRDFDRFGFVTVNKNLLRALVDALPEEMLRDIAISQSVVVEEFVNFFFKKKDVDSILAAISMVSKYLRTFEYTVARNDREVTIAMRTNLGRKFNYFLGTLWDKGIARTLGVAPRVELEENQITFVLPNLMKES